MIVLVVLRMQILGGPPNPHHTHTLLIQWILNGAQQEPKCLSSMYSHVILMQAGSSQTIITEVIVNRKVSLDNNWKKLHL